MRLILFLGSASDLFFAYRIYDSNNTVGVALGIIGVIGILTVVILSRKG